MKYTDGMKEPGQAKQAKSYIASQFSRGYPWQVNETRRCLISEGPTNALDSRTEGAIQSTLDGVVRNRTTIVIAHRLSTVVGADQIVVLDAGRVAERGTHAELLAKGGLYAELWARQAAERELEEVAEG
jgi:ABC-type transport system involved in cytochrome bd biosynthesis fused ATPase/permease subunit